MPVECLKVKICNCTIVCISREATGWCIAFLLHYLQREKKNEVCKLVLTKLGLPHLQVKTISSQYSFTPCIIWYLFHFSKLRLTDKCVSVSHSRNTHSVAACWHGDFRQRYVMVQLKVINRIVFHVFDTTVPFKQRLFLMAVHTSVQTCLLSN